MGLLKQPSTLWICTISITSSLELSASDRSKQYIGWPGLTTAVSIQSLPDQLAQDKTHHINRRTKLSHFALSTSAHPRTLCRCIRPFATRYTTPSGPQPTSHHGRTQQQPPACQCVQYSGGSGSDPRTYRARRGCNC